MVVVYKGTPREHREPPYTEEEEYEAYRAMGGAKSLTMTSVTRPSSTPVSKTGDPRPPAKPRK